MGYDCATCKDKGWVINKASNIREGCYVCDGAPHGVSTRVADDTTNKKVVQAVQPTTPQPAVERLRQHIWLNGSGIAVTCRNQKIYDYKKNSSSPWKEYDAIRKRLPCLYCHNEKDRIEASPQTLLGSYAADQLLDLMARKESMTSHMNT